MPSRTKCSIDGFVEATRIVLKLLLVCGIVCSNLDSTQKPEYRYLFWPIWKFRCEIYWFAISTVVELECVYIKVYILPFASLSLLAHTYTLACKATLGCCLSLKREKEREKQNFRFNFVFYFRRVAIVGNASLFLPISFSIWFLLIYYKAIYYFRFLASISCVRVSARARFQTISLNHFSSSAFFYCCCFVALRCSFYLFNTPAQHSQKRTFSKTPQSQFPNIFHR